MEGRLDEHHAPVDGCERVDDAGDGIHARGLDGKKVRHCWSPLLSSSSLGDARDETDINTIKGKAPIDVY